MRGDHAFEQLRRFAGRDLGATRRWLNDIRHHIALAQTFIAGMDYAAFKEQPPPAIAEPQKAHLLRELARSWSVPGSYVAEPISAKVDSFIDRGSSTPL